MKSRIDLVATIDYTWEVANITWTYVILPSPLSAFEHAADPTRSIIELNLMIVCGCLPTFRAFLGYHFPRLVGGPTDFRRPTGSNSASSTKNRTLRSWLSRSRLRPQASRDGGSAETPSDSHVDSIEKQRSLDDPERGQITKKTELRFHETRATSSG
jgi:hypothetical protein